MKTSISSRTCLAASLLLLLGGCASTGGSGAAGAHANDNMDMQAMCSKHKHMMAGKSPQEQQTMMHEQMKSMSPQMRERMQAMMQQCH